MDTNNLQTPAILVDLDALEKNISKYQALADEKGKDLWPMIKTHKSLEICRMQKNAGAKGFLCGTLDECEMLAENGFDNIMYAYPVAGEANIKRIAELSGKSNFFIRLDDADCARSLNSALISRGARINYTIIVDSGLHRFGVSLDNLENFAGELSLFENLIFKGISTHPGQVYACETAESVANITKAETDTMEKAVKILKSAGFEFDMVTSGSTPTYEGALESDYINIFHPGNYVFMDNIQMSLGCAKEEDCSLTVLATIISNPREGIYIMDAGAKCLGLDQGAHGNSAIKGFGYVKNHPELFIYSLSEEVGKIQALSPCNLKAGDKIQIIPNHSCSSGNLTDYLIGIRNGFAEKLISVNARGNSTEKGIVTCSRE